MLFVIEIILLIAGIWALATGKIPALIAGPQYQIEGRNARLLGLVLILPLPVAFTVGFILALFLAEQATAYAAAAEFFIIIVVLVSAVIIMRRVRRPIGNTGEAGNITTEAADVEVVIAKKAQGSMIYALLGILGFTAIIVCPLAFIRANQALGLIEKHQVGENYRASANLARILAAIIFLFYGGVTIFLLSVVLIGL